MTEDQKSKCRKIIHGAAAVAGAGNLVPIPGTGVAADTVAMTTMAIGLAAVLGGSLTEEAARALAINSVKQTMIKQPVRLLAREVTKFVPLVGQLIAPAVSIAIVEAAGWAMAADLERRFAPGQ